MNKLSLLSIILLISCAMASLNTDVELDTTAHVIAKKQASETNTNETSTIVPQVKTLAKSSFETTIMDEPATTMLPAIKTLAVKKCEKISKNGRCGPKFNNTYCGVGRWCSRHSWCGPGLPAKDKAGHAWQDGSSNNKFSNQKVCAAKTPSANKCKAECTVEQKSLFRAVRRKDGSYVLVALNGQCLALKSHGRGLEVYFFSFKRLYKNLLPKFSFFFNPKILSLIKNLGSWAHQSSELQKQESPCLEILRSPHWG